MSYTYTIIEKEVAAINSLERFFKGNHDYRCVGISSAYDESLDIILKEQPNLIFINLDGGYNAFDFVNDLYKYIKEIPKVVGLSTHKEFAYLSIKNNFFDYLLKPLNQFELRKSISRLSIQENSVSDKLCLKSYKDYRFIDLDEILFLKADNNTTDFFMNDGNVISAYKTLKFFEDSLPQNFTRIHHSYIINQNFVSRIHFGKSECSLKKNDYQIPFSRSYRNNVVYLEKRLSKKALQSLN